MLNSILTRRSIRKFKSKALKTDDLETILKAAMAAPTAGNSQIWEFIVINDRVLFNAIEKFHPYAQMVLQAPVAILVCADLNREKYKDRWPLDCAAASENILLAAHSLNLGAVWVGIYPDKQRMNEMVKLLELPKNIKPVSLIPIGYAAEEKPESNRFDRDKIHYNKF
jgi:nitroreductase